MPHAGNRSAAATHKRGKRLPIWGLWALLTACGPPTWAGGIHALLGWSTRAVRVAEVPALSPAERAGLRPGDLIIAIDGKSLSGLSSEQVHQLLSGEVGSTVELLIERDKRRETLRVERAPYETRRSP